MWLCMELIKAIRTLILQIEVENAITNKNMVNNYI